MSDDNAQEGQAPEPVEPQDPQAPQEPQGEVQQPQGHVEQIGIEDEMRASYIDYSMSVIVGRALPDVRDGIHALEVRLNGIGGGVAI